MREFSTYGPLMAVTIPAAFVIAFAIVQRGVRQVRYGVTAALFLLFGIPLLGGGILYLVYALPWICGFDSCPPDIAASFPGPLLIALSLGAVCCGTGWVLALLSLARQRMWPQFSLILLLLLVVILISALALSQSI
jgi:hypothetical protein